MSLSKKNLDKLNKYKKNKNLNNDSNNINTHSKIDNYDNSTKNLLKPQDPNKIFYSYGLIGSFFSRRNVFISLKESFLSWSNDAKSAADALPSLKTS